jgi:hypothetical protein
MSDTAPNNSYNPYHGYAPAQELIVQQAEVTCSLTSFERALEEHKSRAPKPDINVDVLIKHIQWLPQDMGLPLLKMLNEGEIDKMNNLFVKEAPEIVDRFTLPKVSLVGILYGQE